MSEPPQMENTQMPAPAEHAGLPPSSTALAGPRSGRGKQLTAQEVSALYGLCKARLNSGRFADQPKRFWREVAQAFERQTGRPYSWQSCRRRITKLESEVDPQQADAPVPTPPVPAEPSQPAFAVASVNDDTADDLSDDDEDGLPPATSPVRESIHRRFDPMERAIKETCAKIVSESVDNTDIKMQAFAHLVFNDPHDLRKVQKAFSEFKKEFDLALEKAKRGQEEGRQ
ncbi:uncharacterized protein N7496_001945 [Penicillium cataractarum]|uniref:Myb/SANT-like domain-containing protein n=1 Tax=Penicillium cataractarum TaxID=2100454 RepID=A0A9X0B7J1_9EURO|nr:uncharacterized protein N7496_001945 [Penicillium cataractarum]KAJ5390877.1 hypothetical protein N7496_001945 [Penicillium cataractarum]